MNRTLALSVVATLAAAQAHAQATPGQPIPRSDPNGVYCREYTQLATVNGQKVKTYGTACQQPDGTWKIISNNAQPTPDAPPPEYLGPPVYTTPPVYVAPPVAYYYPAPVYYGDPYPYPYYGGVAIEFGGGWHDGCCGGWHDHGGYYRH